MKVLHILLSAADRSGGPPMVVRDLANALGRMGVEVAVVSLTQRGAGTLGYEPQVRLRLCGDAVSTKFGLPLSGDLPRAMLTEIKNSDIVHLHDLWHFPQAFGALIAVLKG